jgi:hypothetical protein
MRSLGDILYNFHWVVPGECARAAQAWAGGVGRFLERRGIKALINLRGRNDDLSWWKNETGAAEARGIAHLDAMLDSRRLPTQPMLMRLIEAFDSAPRPFVVKCSGGQARAQYARFPYLHFPKKHQRWLRLFLDFAAEDAHGVPLARWIRDRYTPERLKQWLDGRGLNDSYAGIFVVPTRSPFQW